MKNIHGVGKNVFQLTKHTLSLKNAINAKILKNDSNMTCSTTWYGDIVYSEDAIRMHAFGKHFFPL